jgi:hypothetical protein
MIINVDIKSWHGNTIRSRFEEKLMYEPNTGCWLWTASTRGNNNYGALRVGSSNTPMLAHRLSYIINKGIIPKDKQVLHTCDMALCCNPNHLYLGTQQENIKDRDKRGRQRNKHSAKQLGYVSYLEGGT